MIRNRYLLFAFRLIVGGVFIWAGLLKFFDPLDFAQNIKNYQIFPQEISFLLALILPWTEVICGVFLVLGIFHRASSLLASLLLAAFVILVSVTMARGIDTDCGCFGSFSHKADFRLILTDGILFFFSLNILLSSLRVSKRLQ